MTTGTATVQSLRVVTLKEAPDFLTGEEFLARYAERHRLEVKVYERPSAIPNTPNPNLKLIRIDFILDDAHDSNWSAEDGLEVVIIFCGGDSRRDRVGDTNVYSYSGGVIENQESVAAWKKNPEPLHIYLSTAFAENFDRDVCVQIRPSSSSWLSRKSSSPLGSFTIPSSSLRTLL